MKIKFLFTGLILLAISTSCNFLEDIIGGKNTLKGEPSPMINVGEKMTGSNAVNVGVTGASAIVTASENGVATFSGEATITNPTILNVISNIPEFKVTGNKVTVTGLKAKVTLDGVESKISSYPGILVKYDSEVGDTYDAGSGVKRKVTAKSTTDDYPWGIMYIKVIKVEESPSLIPGVKKMVYYANHKWGIVGLEVTFEDNTVTKFTTYCTASNS
jgi:hypothetical protein